jgi:hypothetical protein
MQRSSETIGTIAGALAKAQAELTNPEKSLVDSHRWPWRGRTVVSLCAALQRARDRTQDLESA